ncbi:MAG: hypothetical protein K9K79_09860 [Desulfohalobiaceae bacterium]|nr:hypothetical protein [Desulfohalobiaceae bacterium]
MRPFRLQAVLDYRKRVENEARKSFLLCLEEQRACAAQKEQKEHEAQRLHMELQEAKTNEVLLPEVMLYEECIASKKREILEFEQKIRSLKLKGEQKNQVLVRASQEKRALELLKEKREEKAREKLRHLENTFLDEIAVLGHGVRK